MSDEARERLRRVLHDAFLEYEYRVGELAERAALDALSAHLSDHPEDAEALGFRQCFVGGYEFDIEYGDPDKPSRTIEDVPSGVRLFAAPQEKTEEES